MVDKKGETRVMKAEKKDAQQPLVPYKPSITHEYLWLVKKDPDSQIEYRVLHAHGIPTFSYQMVIEVQVRNGVIVGTNSNYQQILRNEPKYDASKLSQSSNIITLFTSCGTVDIVKEEPDRITSTFNAHLISSHLQRPVLLESLTQEEWTRLQDLSRASVFFQGAMTILHYEYSFGKGEESKSGTETKQILLSLCMNNYSRGITAGVESLTPFQSLPLEDQVILLKDSTCGMGFILSLLVYDRNTNSKLYPALDGNLIFGEHMSNYKLNSLSQPFDVAFTQVFRHFYECLRTDPFVINVLCLLFFFQSRYGLSSDAEIILYQESLLYSSLLEKYFKTKLPDWHEITDRVEVWQNMQMVLREAEQTNEIYRQFSTTYVRDQRLQASSLPRHNSVWLEMAPDPKIDCQVIEVTSTPCLYYTALIEVSVAGASQSFGVPLEDVIPICGNCHMDSNVRSRVSCKTIKVKLQNGQELSLQKLGSDNESFEVLMITPESIVALHDMTDSIWRRLSEVASATLLLKESHNARYSIPSGSSFISPDGQLLIKRVSITLSWETVVIPISKAYELIDSYRNLCPYERDILCKESIAEVWTLQLAGYFNRETECAIHYALKGQVMVCEHISQYQKNENYQGVYESIRQLMDGFHDFLRRDSLLISILSLLSLFQERKGIINSKEVVQYERQQYLLLLKKYIDSKVTSGEWPLSQDEIWDVIQLKMLQISGMKEVIENMVVSEL